MLRLFNLCEIGPTVSKMGGQSESESGGPGGRPGSAGGPQRSDASAPSSRMRPNGSVSDLRALRPLSRTESGSSLHQQGAAAAAAQQQQQQQQQAAGREEGEVSPEPDEQRQQHLGLQPPQMPQPQPQPHGSPGKDRCAGPRAGAVRGAVGCSLAPACVWHRCRAPAQLAPQSA